MPTAHKAGELPRRTVDRVDLCGSVLVGNSGLVPLTGYETQLLNLMRGEVKEITLTVDGQPVEIALRRRPRILVEMDENGTKITVKMPLRIQGDESERLTRGIYEDTAALLLKLQQNGMDAVGAGKRARRMVWTLEDWEGMEWEERFMEAEWMVTG